jgi:hypothetical protein
MRAAALNYVDLAIVEGTLAAALHLPLIPVADGAGIVEQVGADVRGYSPSDLVSTVYIAPWQAGRYTSELTGLEIRPGQTVLIHGTGDVSVLPCRSPSSLERESSLLRPVTRSWSRRGRSARITR